jgi:hypothetical protein
MIGDLLKNVAPGLATVVAGPMGGMAVKMIADKLGVPANEKAIEAHLKAHPEDAAKLAEIDLQKMQTQAGEMQNARQRELDLVNSAAPLINKLVTPVLALGVTLLTFLLFAVIIFVDVNPMSKDILIYILGVLSAALTQILSYYFGSSLGSKEKDDKMKGLK